MRTVTSEYRERLEYRPLPGRGEERTEAAVGGERWRRTCADREGEGDGVGGMFRQ